MRAAAIFGLGCSDKSLKPFQVDSSIEWRVGLPAADHVDVVLLFGGDGTLHRHLPELVKLGLPVLVVPAGSGNDFARALGLHNVRDSLAAWRRFLAGQSAEQSKVRAIDLGTIAPMGKADQAPAAQRPTYFCSVAGVGLDAEVAKLANSLPRWLRGRGGYALAFMRTAFRFAPFAIEIRPSDAGVLRERCNRPILLAAFANTSSYGDGMKIAPQARMDDGKLDVCVLGGMNPFRLAALFPTVYLGQHLRVRAVKYFQAERVRVDTETPVNIYADGEFVCQTPAEIGVERGVLKMIL